MSFREWLAHLRWICIITLLYQVVYRVPELLSAMLERWRSGEGRWLLFQRTFYAVLNEMPPIGLWHLNTWSLTGGSLGRISKCGLAGGRISLGESGSEVSKVFCHSQWPFLDSWSPFRHAFSLAAQATWCLKIPVHHDGLWPHRTLSPKLILRSMHCLCHSVLS